MSKHPLFLIPLLAGFILGFAGCSGDDTASSGSDSKGDEENAPIDGKADSFFNPTEHGDLTFGVPAQGTFTDDEHFHAWTFTLTGDADVTLSSPNVTPNLDTVVYLSGQRRFNSSQKLPHSVGNYRFVKTHRSRKSGLVTGELLAPDLGQG